MKLFEIQHWMGGLPTTAGIAKLRWVGNTSPERKGDTITLPKDDDIDFFPLKNGEQFVLCCDDEERLFFGGTDEKPFLVELDYELKVFLKKGEETFLKALKPDSVALLEEKFRTQAIRQGDWFAVPIPYTWDSAQAFFAFFTNTQIERLKPRPKSPKKTGSDAFDRDLYEVALRNTSHTLSRGRFLRLERNELDCVLIGEGTLQAPDHKPLRLKGPHAFFQMACLVDSDEAD